MNMQIKKSLNDLRSAPRQILLAIFALIIGQWGIGAIYVSYTILSKDINENYLRTRPPHVVLTSKDFQSLDLTALRSRPDIDSAEFRDLSMQRVEAYPNEWIPLWLFGVDDFEHSTVALIQNEAGNSIPKPGTVLLERNGRFVSNLGLDTTARVRVGKNIRDIPISGISFDPAQAPATQDHFIYAYADRETYTQLTGEATQQRLIVRFKSVQSKNDVSLSTDQLIKYFHSLGITVSSVKIPPFDEHPHQWQLNTILALQGGIGLLAFLMSAFLVSQLMAAILAKHVRQIGILRAIGATRLQVLAMYLLMVTMMGFVSSAVAVPLAITSGYAFSHFVADKLNFDVLTTALPHSTIFLFGFLGLILPALLSLPAILRGINRPVHAALVDFGTTLGRNNSTVNISPWMTAPMWLTLALRNGLRQKRRSMVTVLTMALGVGIFSTGFNVRQSLANLLAEFDHSMQYDVQLVLNEQRPKESVVPIFSNIENLDRIETWNGGRGELQSQVVATDTGLGIVALPYDTALFKPNIAQGRWLHIGERPEMVLNQQAMELLGNPPLGSSRQLDIGGKLFDAMLVGVIEELEKPKVYVDQAQYDQRVNPSHRINSLMFVAKSKKYEDIIALKRNIESAIASTDLKVLYVMSKAERVKIVYDHLNIVLTIMIFLSLIVLAVSALGMASAMGINIQERTREIGVMRAIGATPTLIFKVFVAEGMLISVASIFLGLLLAWPISRVASLFFGELMLGNGASLHYAFSGEGFVISLIATIFFGWLASRIPARRAIHVSTRDALAYE